MDIICTICWESLENGRVFATTCGHVFHENCIVNWITRSPCCPECRHETTCPMRLIHFTWQEQIDTQEMQSLESLEHAGASAEPTDLGKTMSTEDLFSGCGDSERNSEDMEVLQQAIPLNAQKSFELDSSQRSDEDGCGVCSRFHFLLEKAIKLRNIIREHEKGGSSSATASEGYKLPLLPGPKAKRKRQL